MGSTRRRFGLRHALGVLSLVVPTAATMTGCIGSSGGETFDFEGGAAGPADAHSGAPLRFTTPRGYDVELTRASLRIGAVYMNELLPVSNAQADSCLSSGRYTAEISAGLDVNLLDERPQRFTRRGSATTAPARAGEVWLTGSGDIYDESDTTPIFEVEGTATRDGRALPFKGRLTIAENRKRPPPSPAQPGANPLCRERIVAPIPRSIAPSAGGALLVRVDPRRLFLTVDFQELKQFSKDPPLFGFQDEAADGPSVAVFAALRSAALYTFEWRARL